MADEHKVRAIPYRRPFASVRPSRPRSGAFVTRANAHSSPFHRLL